MRSSPGSLVKLSSSSLISQFPCILWLCKVTFCIVFFQIIMQLLKSISFYFILHSKEAKYKENCRRFFLLLKEKTSRRLIHQNLGTWEIKVGSTFHGPCSVSSFLTFFVLLLPSICNINWYNFFVFYVFMLSILLKHNICCRKMLSNCNYVWV